MRVSVIVTTGSGKKKVEKTIQCSMGTVPTYCGGSTIGNIKSGNDIISEYYRPATAAAFPVAMHALYRNDTWTHKLFMSEGDVCKSIATIFKDISEHTGRETYALKCGRTKHLVILPPQFKGEVAVPPSEEEGAAFQDIIFRCGKKHVSRQRGNLKYKTYHNMSKVGSLLAISDGSKSPIGYVIDNDVRPPPTPTPQSLDYNRSAFRMHQHHTHANLPWFCPVNRKYSLEYRLRGMIDAYKDDKCKRNMAVVFDHWDLLSPSSSKLNRTIQELYFLQKDGKTSVKVGKDTLHFNVFMPLGTNRNYRDHATSGMAISITNPITFEAVK